MKHYPYTLLISCVIAILSLMPVPEIPLAEVHFIDKWTHLLMYFGLTSACWLDHCRLHGLKLFRAKTPFFAPRQLRVQELSTSVLIWFSLVYPILLGGLMELLQAYCTNHTRSGDWVDWLADTVGSLIGYVFCSLLVHLFFDKKTPSIGQ